MRKIETDDIWSAFRGCQMASKTRCELDQLILNHEGSEYFASQVIVEAARQAIASKLYRKD